MNKISLSNSGQNKSFGATISRDTKNYSEIESIPAYNTTKFTSENTNRAPDYYSYMKSESTPCDINNYSEVDSSLMESSYDVTTFNTSRRQARTCEVPHSLDYSSLQLVPQSQAYNTFDLSLRNNISYGSSATLCIDTSYSEVNPQYKMNHVKKEQMSHLTSS